MAGIMNKLTVKEIIPTFLQVAELVLKSKDALWIINKTRVQRPMTLKEYAKTLHH